MQALLKGLGVGDDSATAGAAALTFLQRDGAGMMGGLVLAWTASRSFGRNVKAWRLFADVANDLALTIDLWAPRFAPGMTFVVLVCVSSVLKAWCGVAAGATRAVITNHFAKRSEDVADVAAKEGSQETAVTLIGMVLGSLFLKFISDPFDAQASLIWGLFWVMTSIHVVANYAAVEALNLRTLNWARLKLALNEFGGDEQFLGDPSWVSGKESWIKDFFSNVEEGLPKFGSPQQLKQNFVSHEQINDVAFCGKFILVSRNACADSVAALAVSYVLLKNENDRERANRLPECLEVAQKLKERGWDLEASRSLWGDEMEERVDFL